MRWFWRSSHWMWIEFLLRSTHMVYSMVYLSFNINNIYIYIYVIITVLQYVTLNWTMVSLDSRGTWRSHLPWLTGERAVLMPTVQIEGKARTLRDALSLQNRAICDLPLMIFTSTSVYLCTTTCTSLHIHWMKDLDISKFGFPIHKIWQYIFQMFLGNQLVDASGS